MGTRSGSIDPAIIEYIAKRKNLDVYQVTDILNKESGVLGLSGVSSDFRDIEGAAAKGNTHAQLALDLFYYQVVKFIGSYIAVLGGVDAIVFAGGLGENSPELREWVIDHLNGFGICLKKELNNFKGEFRDLTGQDSKAKVYVIPTNEELMIARDTRAIVER